MKYLFACLLFFDFHLAHSQQIAIQTDRTCDGYIYKCYYNRIKIVIEGMSCSDIDIKSDSFDIKKIENCFFYIRAIGKPSMPMPIEIVNAKTGKHIQTEYIEFIDSLPLPQLKLNAPREREYGSSISLSSDSVYCVAPFSDRYNQTIKFSILSYKAEVISKDKIVYSESITGPLISKQIKQYLPKLYRDDKVILKSIKVRDQNGNEYLIPQKVLPLGY